tara:strand:- start:195 stop:371 length:177 start_codon:yes stop_codon:yes gene_type:complete
VINKKNVEEHLGYEISEEVFDEMVCDYHPYDDELERMWLDNFINDDVVESINEELEVD